LKVLQTLEVAEHRGKKWFPLEIAAPVQQKKNDVSPNWLQDLSIGRVEEFKASATLTQLLIKIHQF